MNNHSLVKIADILDSFGLFEMSDNVDTMLLKLADALNVDIDKVLAQISADLAIIAPDKRDRIMLVIHRALTALPAASPRQNIKQEEENKKFVTSLKTFVMELRNVVEDIEKTKISLRNAMSELESAKDADRIVQLKSTIQFLNRDIVTDAEILRTKKIQLDALKTSAPELYAEIQKIMKMSSEEYSKYNVDESIGFIIEEKQKSVQDIKAS